MARVVVVEDSPVTRQLLAAIVEAAGHELLAACDNGLDGLKAIQHHLPDVALLDMLLPQLDGVQVLQRLQAAGVSVPVIMLSSVTAADRIQAARAAGVRHYLLKPFDAQKVMATLERVLNGGTGPLNSPTQAAPAATPPAPAATQAAPAGGQANLAAPTANLAGLTPPAGPGSGPAGALASPPVVPPRVHLPPPPVVGTGEALVPQGGPRSPFFGHLGSNL